jgi:hypothetical protein
MTLRGGSRHTAPVWTTAGALATLGPDDAVTFAARSPTICGVYWATSTRAVADVHTRLRTSVRQNIHRPPVRTLSIVQLPSRTCGSVAGAVPTILLVEDNAAQIQLTQRARRERPGH